MSRLSFICYFVLLALIGVGGEPAAGAPRATGALGGRVAAADSGAALSGVLVTAYSDSRGEARSATTNAQGVFAISGLSPGRYFVDFTSPEGSRYASHAMFVENGVNRGGGREVDIAAERTRMIEQRLEVGAEIELRFEDGAGVEWNPADSGAEPTVTIVEDFPDGAQRRLTPTGMQREGALRRMVFKGLPRTNGASVLAQVPGYLALNPPEARLVPGQRSVVVVRLDRGDPTGVEGLAPPGARVVVVTEPAGRQVSEIGADREGRFSISGFYPGLYGLRMNGISEGLIEIVKDQRTRVDLRPPELAMQAPLLPELPPAAGAPGVEGIEAVKLELIVRDPSGRTLRDIRPEEVEVYEDGVRQEIKGLRHVDGGTAAGEPAVRLTLVVDLVSAAGWEQAMSAASDLVGRLAPGSLVSAFRLGSTLTPILGATADRVVVFEALSGKRPILAAPTASPQASTPAGAADPVALDAVRLSHSFGAQGRDHRAIYGLLSLVEAQGRLPGRKALVYLCEGFALSSEHEGAFRSLIAAANRAHVGIYVIDLRGMDAEEQLAMAQAVLATEGEAPADGAPADAAGAAAMAAAVADWKSLLQVRTDERAVIEELSSGTGAFVIANRDLLERGLGWIADDLEHYDELTYAPANAPAGEAYRRIKVRVQREGIRAQYRDGYFPLTPLGGGPLLMYEVPLLRALLDDGTREDFPLQLTTLRFGAEGEGVRVAWLAEMRRADITFASYPGEGELRGGVSCLTLVRDARGELVLRRSRDLPLKGTRERLAELVGQRIQFLEHALLPAGEYTLETALHDEEGARLTVRRERLLVAAPSPGLGLGSVVVASSFITPALSDPTDPLQVRSFRVVPSGDGSARLEPGVLHIPVYCVVFPIPGAAEPPDLTVDVLRDGYTVSSGALRLPAPDDLGAIRHISSVPMERLREGRYQVRVRATQDGRTVEQTMPLTMRPPTANADLGAVRIVERARIVWPESAPTSRVLLDVKEEKVALGLVKPLPPRRKGWSPRKIAVTALAGFGAAGAGLALTRNTPPVFAAYPTEGIASATIFEFNVGGDVSGTCSWSFGDGKNATGQSVTHVYEDSGIYSAQLLVDGKSKGVRQILVDSLSAGGWRLRGHRIDLIQTGSRLVAVCFDHPDAEVKWECRWEGSVSAPNRLALLGPWAERSKSGELLDSQPSVVVEGTVVSSRELLLSIDGSTIERVDCCSTW